MNWNGILKDCNIYQTKRDDISSLKKKIKYCKNPMEKKKLEQELNLLYKKRKRWGMKVRALFTGCDLTEGKIYDVIFEYDTVYELQCDTGQYCRPKTFFEIVEEDR